MAFVVPLPSTKPHCSATFHHWFSRQYTAVGSHFLLPVFVCGLSTSLYLKRFDLQGNRCLSISGGSRGAQGGARPPLFSHQQNWRFWANLQFLFHETMSPRGVFFVVVISRPQMSRHFLLHKIWFSEHRPFSPGRRAHFFARHSPAISKCTLMRA